MKMFQENFLRLQRSLPNKKERKKEIKKKEIKKSLVSLTKFPDEYYYFDT